MKHHVPDEHRSFAQRQRREPTRAEALVWHCLRAGRLDGWKFKRQVPFGPYVADFSCADARLIVELDGRPHDDPAQQARDAARDRWFTARGFTVLRLPNDRVLGSIELAMEDIQRALRSPAQGERRLGRTPRGGRSDAPQLAPLPARSARHPPPGRGRVE